MASPSLIQGVMMSSPASDLWWGQFLVEHGRDSEEEKAFLGYLSSHGIPAGSDPAVLAAAYAEFLVFVEESYAREHEESAEEKRTREALVVERPRVPRSSLSLPELEKPMTAATRPLEWREKEAAPPSGRAPRAPAETPPPAPERSSSARRGE
jgi:hypothetical protein